MSVEQVYSSRAEMRPAPAALTPRLLVAFSVMLLACVAAWVSTVGALYVQNAMWTVPWSEIGSGAHDPKDLAHPRAGGSTLLGLLSIMVTSFLAGAGAFFLGADVAHSVRSGRTRRQVAPVAVVLVLSVVILLGCIALAPLGTWYLD